jgi:hypothetical protein
MTDTELFDLCLAEFERLCYGMGKRFEPLARADGAPTFFAERSKMARGRIQATRDRFPKLSDVYFDFVDNATVGAWTWSHEDRHFIGYSAGTEHMLVVVFSRLLADRNVFAFLCGREDELPDQEVWDALAADVRTVANVKAVIPRDMRRKVLATWLRHIVADFIVCHELAHLLQGHFGYRRRYFPLSPLIDPSRPSNAAEADLVEQTQEMYADAEAVWTVLFQLESFIGNGSGFPAPLNEYCRNPRVMLFLWLFAIFVFCRLKVLHHPTGDESLADEDLQRGTHPPWRFRQWMITQHVQSYIGRSTGLGHLRSIPNLMALVGLGLRHAESAVSAVTNRPFPEGLISDWQHPKVQSHRDKLIAIWRGGVRQAHEEFKIGVLPT